MKITIDTKEDSKDEIVKVIRMLSELVNHKTHSDMFSDEPTDNPVPVMSMFDNPISEETKEEDVEKKRDDSVQIVPY